MIEVRKLSKSFGSFKALTDVSFTVQKGHIVGFLGANGAGKTTTMDIMTGCTNPDAGEVTIDGDTLSEAPVAVKSKLGYLPDEPPVYREMRVADYIRHAGKLRGLTSPELDQKVEAIIGQLDLDSVRSRIIGQLSKGFRQRVGLAQALIHEPQVLILDEPTEGLDPKQIVQIRHMIASLKGKQTILFSSHILSEVQSLCDEIIIIDKGQIIEQGTYEAIINKAGSSTCYLIETAAPPAKLKGPLMAIDGVVDVKADLGHDALEVYVGPSVKNLDAIATAVVAGGFGLMSISRHAKSLEEVFFQLTKDTAAEQPEPEAKQEQPTKRERSS